MKENFWEALPRPFFILAPMEDVTDVVFRHVVSAAARPDVFFTEFANTESYCHPKGRDSLRGRLTFTEDEQPIVAHIWGDKAEHFKTMSIDMAKRGFQGIDINMGCPVQNVAANGKGAGLIRRPDVATDIIEAAKLSGLPVSVKTRLGYSDVSEWHVWLEHILKQNIVNLSIHLRTRKEMSDVPAHWDIISDIKRLRDEIAPNTLLTINGDIPNKTVGQQLVKQYGVDGVMIGRGIFKNPFAFSSKVREPNRDELLELLKLHLDLFDKYFNHGERPFKPLRRFFKIYVRSFHGANELRQHLMETESTHDVREVVRQFEENFQK